MYIFFYKLLAATGESDWRSFVFRPDLSELNMGNPKLNLLAKLNFWPRHRLQRLQRAGADGDARQIWLYGESSSSPAWMSRAACSDGISHVRCSHGVSLMQRLVASPAPAVLIM